MNRDGGALDAPARGAINLSAADARRIALAAQGFRSEARAKGSPPARLHEVLEDLRLLQIDSVNVLVRAHYFPLFSRRGPYDRAILDRLAYQDRGWFETWGHEASLLPVRLHPLLRWRMERAPWPAVSRVLESSPAFVDDLLRRIAAEGPLAASDLAGDAPRSRGMWNWGPSKHVVEWLFATGRLAVSSRRGFERLYDLPERVLPPEVLAARAPPADDAKASLLVESSQALGVGTLHDLADYFRIRVPVARPLVARLVEEGRLTAVCVEGWRQEAYLAAKAPPQACPVSAHALLCPFDSLVFHRDRTERLFGFHYRIEIYVPAKKRRHGYYVLPFLMDEALRARVDLKADRATGRLLVRAAHLEPGEDPARVAGALAEELRLLASWLDLSRIAVSRRGSFHRPLRAALAGR